MTTLKKYVDCIAIFKSIDSLKRMRNRDYARDRNVRNEETFNSIPIAAEASALLDRNSIFRFCFFIVYLCAFKSFTNVSNIIWFHQINYIKKNKRFINTLFSSYL